MAGEDRRSILTLVLAVIVVFSCVPSGVQVSSTINQLQQRRSQLKEQQEVTAAKLKQLRADKTKQQKYKNTLDTQVQAVQSQTDTLDDRVATLDAGVKEKESQIAEKQKSTDANTEQLKQRVRAIYLPGESSQLEMILGAQDVMGFLDKTELVRSTSQHDQQVIQTLKTDVASIKTQKEQIKQNRQSVAQAKKGLGTENPEPSGLLAESSRILAEISANVVSTNSENNYLAAERKKVGTGVDQRCKNYYASIKDNNKGNQASNGYVSKGQLTWPFPGYTKITACWGDNHGHKGIDITGSGVHGEPIVVADNGKVILTVQSGWSGGHDLCAYVDHGDRYSTRYGHMNEIIVKAGGVVKKGQTVGYIGNTDDSTGPHLYFEIRMNGVAQNPTKWFS